MSPPARIDIAALKDACPIVDVVRAYGVTLRREGRELVGLSPFKAERTPSFYVHPRKQAFKCFSSGQGGDVINFVMAMDGVTFVEAARRLAEKAGLAASVDAAARAEQHRIRQRELAEEEEREKRRKARRAFDIWRETVHARGTPVETYLLARGINLDAIEALYGYRVPASLRFHPGLPYSYQGVTHTGPAMVGALYDRHRRFRGIHRTWLRAGGMGKETSVPKAKLTLGAVWGSLGPLSRHEQSAVTGEGYETTLSVMGKMAEAGQRAFFFSALSLGNICGAGTGLSVDPERAGLLLPDGVRELLILGDSDGKDPADTRRQIARGAAKFMTMQKVDVRVAWAAPGMDFNDMVRRRAA